MVDHKDKDGSNDISARTFFLCYHCRSKPCNAAWSTRRAAKPNKVEMQNLRCKTHGPKPMPKALQTSTISPKTVFKKPRPATLKTPTSPTLQSCRGTRPSASSTLGRLEMCDLLEHAGIGYFVFASSLAGFSGPQCSNSEEKWRLHGHFYAFIKLATSK